MAYFLKRKDFSFYNVVKIKTSFCFYTFLIIGFVEIRKNKKLLLYQTINIKHFFLKIEKTAAQFSIRFIVDKM